MTGTAPLQGCTVLVTGRGSGIARAVALTARRAGSRIVAAGRNRAALDAAYRDEPDVTTETVDVTDDASIAGVTLAVDGGEALT